MNHIDNTVFQFLLDHYDPSKPMLLGLSGGPDSLSLFHLLLSFQKKHPLRFGIAHVNHNWRKESVEEAEELKKLAEDRSIPFHLHQLDPLHLKGNLEEASRLERLCFFKRLSDEFGYQATLLGHHADDQAETVLKRIFEGAAISHLSGLQPIAQVEGVMLWRPLLTIPKKRILEWLGEKQIVAFEDATNKDPKYLRSRMRSTLIPMLSDTFGKEISTSLSFFSQESKELDEYLKYSLQPLFDLISFGPMGLMIDFSNHLFLPPFAVKFLLREVCQKEGVGLTRSFLEQAYQLIVSKKGNKSLSIAHHEMQIDRSRFFLMKRSMKELLQSGINWKVSRKFCENSSTQCGWQEVWKGRVCVALPEGEYHLGPAPRDIFDKKWTQAKVPAFLRNIIPALWSDQQLAMEFLLPKVQQDPRRIESGKYVEIHLEFVP